VQNRQASVSITYWTECS